jgi:hypothetical protein
LVFPWRQNELCRRFGTLRQVHLQRLDEYHSYSSPNRKYTRFRTRRKFEIKSVRLYNIFRRFLKSGTIILKNVFWIKHVFLFSLRSLSKTFLILWGVEGDMVKNVYCSSCNESWIFSTSFQKILRYQISWKSVHWGQNCSVWTVVIMDRYDEVSSYFSQFWESAYNLAYFPKLLSYTILGFEVTLCGPASQLCSSIVLLKP